MWIDNTTNVIKQDDNYIGYWEAFYVDANDDIRILDEYPLAADYANLTINFSGTYEGYDVMLAVLARPKSGEDTISGALTEGYIDARGTIVPGEVADAPAAAPRASSKSANIEMTYNNATGLYEFDKDVKFGGRVKFDPAKLSR